ncbi:MarR family winged helix-turn-helix transcriptional regulator [Conexibacter woesei]|uniref:Transcriptional regulator, MarR family n=1 Tax=Conexibacter woesei (strain DSM 14684 / CCUG 47730 / CIP 108061 / JCM 11494 / NBRC 100937 / ID131577) TaxID=469383 RepID=D3FER7_CONWI|nr:MarR family transcriptional regulator [Conexibacter woesei]ADB49741.1 transcriptional regulator, MarR family [Conexibacter woesei DSM 14684]
MAFATSESPSARVASPLRGLASYRLIKLGKLVDIAVDRALSSLGVKSRHFHVLAVIAEGASLSQQEMSRMLDIDPNVMVGLIDDLEEAGLAERTRNPADRRRHVVVITRKGSELLRDGLERGAAFEDELLAALDPDERAALEAASAKLLDALLPTPVSNPRPEG